MMTKSFIFDFYELMDWNLFEVQFLSLKLKLSPRCPVQTSFKFAPEFF